LVGDFASGVRVAVLIESLSLPPASTHAPTPKTSAHGAARVSSAQ
jgi:hypothetical protein